MVYPFKQSEHHQILISEKHDSCTIYPLWVLLRSLYHIQEAFYYGISVPHITVGWKRGAMGGVRLILSLFSQFILSVSAQSINKDPRSLCVRQDVFDINRKLQEAAQMPRPLYCCLHTEQGPPTKMARQAKP